MVEGTLMTGSSRGIGAAIALRLASHGANLVINYVSNESATKDVVEQIEQLGTKAIAVRADVTRKSEVMAMFQEAKTEFGRIDIVMSNSGIEHFGEIPSVTEEDIDKVFNVNVKAQFFVAQAAYEYLEDGGRLMLISSISAVWGVPRHAIYASSKAAVQGMAKCLAVDFGKRGITVNVIAPGGVKTDMYEQVAKEYIPGGENLSIEEIDMHISKMSPLGRPGFTNDVAGVVAFIAGPDSQWLTGQTFHVSGGAHMAS
ncbi:tetrahydroxynaphthalene reductase protein [Rutstroemia sp. NJR-2017a BBW]|nr:tetrahydroxynaphthalene reductase protein [Rutstroemia sp. NJR-2017a BBW]